MYKGKKTLFYNGETLFDEIYEDEEFDDFDELWGRGPIIYDEMERDSWEVIIVLPGVKIIPEWTFTKCRNVETVIMADTVKRIEYHTFYGCDKLEFVRLSKNLELIENNAFYSCQNLASMFIPPSCREIENEAFVCCYELIILSIPQQTNLCQNVIEGTALMKASPFIREYYDDDSEEVNEWIHSINQHSDTFALHRECAS